MKDDGRAKEGGWVLVGDGGAQGGTVEWSEPEGRLGPAGGQGITESLRLETSSGIIESNQGAQGQGAMGRGEGGCVCVCRLG